MIGRLGDHVEQLMHRGRTRREIDLRRQLVELRAQRHHLPLQSTSRPHALDDVPDLLGCERLGQIVTRATLNGIDRRRDGGVRSDDDDLRARALGEHLR